MFITRLINQIIRFILHAENPAWRAIFPIHLCSVMIYLLPLVVIFNLKKIKRPIYFLSILGGAITILVGEYFDNAFITFSSFEGIYAHTLILVGSVFMYAYESKRFDLLDLRDVCISIAILSVWATIFNVILAQFYWGSNYLYLVSNKLPFLDNCFIIIYLLILLSILFFSYLFSNIKHKEKIINELSKYKYKILLGIFLMFIGATIITIITKCFATI